ncbi:PAS/PAC sensor hybrid histidine kinase [Paucimonas lemoignei]|nr:PAS/PAC sensor hybrid histidine kinase [Paucimonas lemoignei]
MPFSQLKILLIEDSPHDAELTLLALEASGIEVDSTLVHNHQGAAKALSEQVFDAVLCDFLLPGSSGADVLKIARELAPETPFIFLSGIFGEQQAVEMMRLGAVDYVLKQNLKMLPKAVKRAVSEVRERVKRRAAETALQEVEVRARLAIEAAMMGVWEFQPTLGRMLWDERCNALYEILPNSQVDLAFLLARCHPDDRPLLESRIHEALTREGDYQIEYRALMPDGRSRWLFSNGRSVFEKGRCVRFTGVMQDITERKQATRELVELNEALGARIELRTRERDRTWELSRELLAVLRLDMTPISFNPAWEATLGWSNEQISQMRLWELIHPADVAMTVHEMESIARGNISTRFVNRMKHRSGDYRWLSWTIVPEGDLMYAAVRDITEERAVIDELAAANQRLRAQITERERIEADLQQMQRLEVVGQLTAGVAHDFNNLLTVILTSTTFAIRDIERGTLDKTVNRLQNVKDAGERGAKLTAQLLSFSRRQRLQPTAISLNDTVRNMGTLLARALGGSIWINTDLAPDLWYAMGDPTQTEMIILNLAINARDAMEMGGSLCFSTFNAEITRPAIRPEDPEPGKYAVLAISDSGSGMSPETLLRAFEPFYTTKDVGKGSGLGLAQVFGFAKQSGGGVMIESELGVGTKVMVYLPSVGKPQDMPDEEVAAPPLVRPSGSRTILLVDDDPAVRSVTLQMLQSLGYAVRQAGSGLQAMEMLDSGIDLVLTDFAMPGMTGGELASLVHQQYPDMPVLFVTGYADIDVLGLEGSSVVQKPFNEGDLISKLHKALSNTAAS